MKERAKVDEKFLVATFNLQQVLYLPISKRCELFYRRKLSCYNITVYNLGNGEGVLLLAGSNCQSWGNEIALCVYDFLVDADRKGVTEAVFFSDGCGGQNKNSILPAMFIYFLDCSVSIQCIPLCFYKTNYGQSEGDAMHSTIERAVRRAGDTFIPTQSAMILWLARKVP